MKDIRDYLEYSIITGQLYWKRSPGGNIRVGSKAGSTSDRYIQVGFDGRLHYNHRVIFYILEGTWPEEEVDHINRCGLHNMWCNLRRATRHENAANRHDINTFMGVKWVPTRSRWRASTPRVDGRQHDLGNFKTHLAACYARHQWDKTH